MSVFTLSWIPFWMLRNHNFEQLSQAEPSVAFDCAKYNLPRIREMMQETIPFLQECCRDILDLRSLRECAALDNIDFASKWHQAEMSFRHRTIFDFLQTPDTETQGLLFTNLPPFFSNKHFKAGLNIMRWSIKSSRVAERPLS